MTFLLLRASSAPEPPSALRTQQPDLNFHHHLDTGNMQDMMGGVNLGSCIWLIMGYNDDFGNPLE
jgi:hypothetical protein